VADEISLTASEQHVAFPARSRDSCGIHRNNEAELLMPDDDVQSAWDFLTVLSWWNLFVLPALLLVAGVVILVGNRRFKRSSIIDLGRDGRRLVTIAALIHLGITIQAVVRLVQELLTMREMGVSESFANLIGQTISVVVNPLLALGLWLGRRAARWTAIGWYVLLSVVGVIVTVWRWRFQAAVDLTWWPDYFAGKLMPLFLLVVMLLPRVKRVFVRSKVAPVPDLGLIPDQPSPMPERRWSIISLIALLCLIVVLSNLAVDSADWIERSLAQSNQSAPDIEPDME
jgi:hypothetical protein